MYRFPSARTLFVLALVSIGCVSSLQDAWAGYARGDLVRLKRGETLMFQGKEMYSAAKDQEFTVLKDDAVKRAVYVEYYQEDGTLIAVSGAAELFEPSPATAWNDLLKGVEAFRDQRYEDAKRLLTRAAQDPEHRQLASALVPKISGAAASGFAARSHHAARHGLATVLQGLRESAAQLAAQGQLCLAVPIDQGVDRLAALIPPGSQPAAPASKLDRAELEQRVNTSNRALGRLRQAMALRRLAEASEYLDEGLKAEPERPELKAIQAKVGKDMADADDHHRNADKMRNRGPKGTIHALTAVEMGLKLCVDHPRLRALKQEMQGAFEERTAPKVTAAFLAAAGAGGSQAALEEGHKIYTSRCTECHDLELLDSRSVTAWRSVVAGMSRRAKISEAQQAKIVEYLTAAQRTMAAADGP